MYELKKIGKVVTIKFVGTGPSSYKKIIYWAAFSQRLRNTDLGYTKPRKMVVFRLLLFANPGKKYELTEKLFK
jgi:hypothetical protein